MIGEQGIQHHPDSFPENFITSAKPKTDWNIPTMENMAALIFPTCEREELGELEGGRVDSSHLIAKVEETDGETTEDDGEVKP